MHGESASVYAPTPSRVVRSVCIVRDESDMTHLVFECDAAETLSFGISTYQSYSEQFGIRLIDGEERVECMQGEPSFEKYIGKYIEVVQYARHERRTYYYEEQKVGVDIKFTDATTITVEIYNDHNGYYPHAYSVSYGSWNDKDEL